MKKLIRAKKEQVFSKHSSFISLIPTLIISVFFIVWSYGLFAQFSGASDMWTKELKLSDEFNKQIRGLAIDIGYGGLIHNFKNYVLRQDQKYYHKIHENYQQFEIKMNKLESLFKTPEEYMRAKALRTAIQHYLDKAETVNTLIAEGKKIEEIDALIKIDDSEALQAMYEFLKLSEDLQQNTSHLTVEQFNKMINAVYQSLFILLLFVANSFYQNHKLKRLSHRWLKEKEDKNELMAVFNGTTSAFILVDPDGKITRANTSAALLTGYAIPELITMKIENLIPSQSRHKHEGHINTYFKNPEYRYMFNRDSIYLLNKEGKSVPVEVGLVGIRTRNALQVLASVNLVKDTNRSAE
jgi:PAS domain S-box-containing protein